MTSNFGAHTILEKFANIDDNNAAEIYDETKADVFEELKLNFRPEFLNRIDEIILFSPLGKKQIGGIVNLYLNGVAKKLAQKDITLDITPEAAAYLAKTKMFQEYVGIDVNGIVDELCWLEAIHIEAC